MFKIVGDYFDDGSRYSVLFESKKYDSIYNKIRYIVSVKSGMTFFTIMQKSK